MKRDFSDRSKQELLNLVTQVENEKLCDFTDWAGDRWYDFSEWIGSLNIKNYLNNVNDYHKMVIDKNNTTHEAIEQIFSDVKGVDNSYADILANLREHLAKWHEYINMLSEIVVPANGNFNAAYMGQVLNPIISDLEQLHVDCLRDKMVQEVNGDLVYDQDLIYEYLKKSPALLTDGEQALLLEILAELKDMVVVYETMSKIGVANLGAETEFYVYWLVGSTEYESFAQVSAHYNEIYVNLLTYMQEQSNDKSTFAASVLTGGIGPNVISLLGVETSENLMDIFGTKRTFDAYLLKYVTEHSEGYFGKLDASEKASFTSVDGIKPVDNLGDWLEENMKKKGLYEKEEPPSEYFDLDGNSIEPADATKFRDRSRTWAELKGQVHASVSIYDGEFDLGDCGTARVTVGEAEAHASISAGLYTIGKGGDKRFSPGVNAEIGASVTALEAGWEDQLLGDENLGVNADASITLGQASAQADMTAQIFSEDGKVNLQVGASAKAEAILAEAEGSVGVNVLGSEVGASGSVNVGVGAHAEVGYRDGVFKADIGASLGVGVSVSLEVDLGGMVDTVVDGASAAWEGIKDGWNAITNWF